MPTRASSRDPGSQLKLRGNLRLPAAREGSISPGGFKKARIFAGNLMQWSSLLRRIIRNRLSCNQQEPTYQIKRNDQFKFWAYNDIFYL